MLSIYRKEISTFLSSLIGYMSLVVFLLVIGLFVWVFPDTSILEYGFATLDPLFFYAPWIFMFLIPAITMRMFAEEFSTGTIEFLSTKPLREHEIILGKYLAAFTLVVLAILPTLIYYWVVNTLGGPEVNMDSGGFWGSFLGLIFLSGAFVAIGLFASSLTSNQIVSFILAVFLCFFVFAAFDLVAKMPMFYGSIDGFVSALGIQNHYASISRGVLDTRDVVYFLSVSAFFIFLTTTSLQSRKW